MPVTTLTFMELRDLAQSVDVHGFPKTPERVAAEAGFGKINELTRKIQGANQDDSRLLVEAYINDPLMKEALGLLTPEVLAKSSESTPEQRTANEKIRAQVAALRKMAEAPNLNAPNVAAAAALQPLTFVQQPAPALAEAPPPPPPQPLPVDLGDEDDDEDAEVDPDAPPPNPHPDDEEFDESGVVLGGLSPLVPKQGVAAVAPQPKVAGTGLEVGSLNHDQAVALQGRLDRYEKMKEVIKGFKSKTQPLSDIDQSALQDAEKDLVTSRVKLAEELLGKKIDPKAPVGIIDDRIDQVSAKITERVEATAPKPKIGIDADDPGAKPGLAVGGNNPALAVGADKKDDKNKPPAQAAPAGTTLTTPKTGPAKGLNVESKGKAPEAMPHKGPDTSWEGLIERFLELLFAILFAGRKMLKESATKLVEGAWELGKGAIKTVVGTAATIGTGLAAVLTGGQIQAVNDAAKWCGQKTLEGLKDIGVLQVAVGAVQTAGAVVAAPFVAVGAAYKAATGDTQGALDLLNNVKDAAVGGVKLITGMDPKKPYEGLGHGLLAAGGIEPKSGITKIVNGVGLIAATLPVVAYDNLQVDRSVYTPPPAKPDEPEKKPDAAKPGAAAAQTVGTPAVPNPAIADKLVAATQNSAAQNTNGVAEIQPAPKANDVQALPLPHPAKDASDAAKPSMAEIQAQAVAAAKAADEARIKAEIAKNEALGIPPPPPPEAAGAAKHGPAGPN